MKEGDKVIINDFSEAHGGTGKIWQIQNGVILVELDENKKKGIAKGTIWPLSDEEELIKK